MEQQLTTTPHPHDPHRDDIESRHAHDLVRYFLGPEYEYHASRAGEGIFKRNVSNPIACGYSGNREQTLKAAGAWPPPGMCPAPPRYIAAGTSVMRGAEPVCVAASNNKAQLIAHALNWYKPGRRYRTNPS